MLNEDGMVRLVVTLAEWNNKLISKKKIPVIQREEKRRGR
jgi:hypothetical protein